MADTLKTMPIASLTDVTPQSSDKLVTYRDSDKDAHVSTVGELSDTLNENLSDAFSTSVSYAVGDYCIYNNTLYKCTTAHNKASWNSSHFEAVTVGEELSELNTNLPDLTYETGEGVRNSSYVNSSTFGATYVKYGRLCIVDFTLLMSAAVNDSDINIVTGLPKPTRATQGVLASGTSSSLAVAVRVNTDGNLRYAWAATLASGSTYRGQVAYITAE